MVIPEVMERDTYFTSKQAQIEVENTELKNEVAILKEQLKNSVEQNDILKRKV